MKVFISHAFGGDDEELAGTLKEDLDAAGLDGYLAEESQRYDLLIGDKIRQEIDESDWLVAIITERGQASASLHEEIGYALKGGARVALMIEEGVEKRGVLVYGKEYETFSVPNFAEHSRKVARSIAESPLPPPRRHPLGEDARAFLEGRKILSDDSPDFAQNAHFASLYSGPLGDDEKPAVIFTACPHGLGDRCDVTTSEFIEWAKSTRYVEVDGRQISVPGIEQSVDINTLRITERHFGTARKNVVLYREYMSTGFLEWGTSYMFFNRNDEGKIEVHLCYMIGLFWAFLASARRFYGEIGMDAPFSVILSIRNSSTLGLRNAGDYVYDDPPTPFSSPPPAQPAPATDRPHIRIEFHFDTVREMTDERIAAVAEKAARDICNAYGQAAPLCYDTDGSFSWRLWDEIHTKAAEGGRL